MSVTIERIFDIDRLKHLLDKDLIYREILNIESLEDVMLDVVFSIWICVYKDMDPIGVMCFTSLGTCLVFHGGAYKQYRNKELVKSIQLVLAKVKAELNCKFLTTIPESNHKANGFVKKLGMIENTRISNGFGKDDMIIYSE